MGCLFCLYWVFCDGMDGVNFVGGVECILWECLCVEFWNCFW